MAIQWQAVEQCFAVVLFAFQFYPFCKMETLSILDLTMSGAKKVKSKVVRTEGLDFEIPDSIPPYPLAGLLTW